MPTVYETTVPGYPHPTIRARSKDGQAQHYDPPENVAAKERIQMFTRWRLPLLAGPLRVDIWFEYERPNPTADLDNLAKTVLDAYNNYVWADDRQIVDLVLHKRGGKPADRTYIQIEENPR